MKRAVVSDLTSPKYSILTTEDLVPNNAPNPKVTRKLAQPKKPRKTVKRKENIYTIHSGEIQVIKEKRTYRKKKKAEEETKSLLRQNLQNYLNYQPNLPRRLITEARGFRGFGGGSQAFSESSAAICSTTLPQQTETPNLDLNSNEKCPKAFGGYRKIHFGNYNVISTGEPTQDHNRVFETILIDDNADFDIFQPPHLKSVPEDIFEPVVIKQEDDGSIINKDVLINSDSSSVVFSLDHGKRRCNEAEMDDRVETLRNINATAQVRGEGDKQAKKKARDKELSAQKNLLDSLDKQIQLLENIVYGPSAETKATAQDNVEAQENPTLKAGDDPFANTFGTPDEVIISETVELEGIEHPVGLGETQGPKTEVIEEEIRGQIRRIITSEEADEGKAETLVEDAKKKVQTLQSVILYFSEVISSEKQQIIEVGFIKTLIDSTLELFTGVNKKKPRKTKSKQCQKIRKLPLKKLQGSNDITMKKTPNQQEIDEESLKQLTSKLSEETNVDNNESFQSPFIFSDIEEVTDVPLRTTAKTASSPTETNEFKYENPHPHVKPEILKTYSRKLGKNLVEDIRNSEFVNTKLTVKLVKSAESVSSIASYQDGETNDKMVAGERKIENEVHSADVPVQPKKTKRRLNTDELMNVVPERRTSERIKKRPNFYGLGIYWK